MILSKGKSDLLGVIASFLCLVHCLATPFIFIIHACSKTCCSATPAWWRWIDILFLVISFIAIYSSQKVMGKEWIRVGLWISWIGLFAIVMNEQFSWIELPETAIYFPAFALIGLHLYNLRQKRCADDMCATN